MANDFSAWLPQVWAREALIALENNLVMANLVHRDFENVIANKGDTVNVKLPASFIVNDFNGAVQLQNITAAKDNVVLDKHKEVSFAITDKELSTVDSGLIQEKIKPAMEAIAEQVDKDLLGLYVDVTKSIGTAGTDITPNLIVDLGKNLNDAKCPKSGRRFVMSSKDEAALLKTDLFNNASSNADGGLAQKEALLGRKFGFDCYMDQNVVVVAGTPDTTYNLGFHRDAFSLVTRPLNKPKSSLGVESAVVNYKGIGLRTILSYNADKLQHQMTIDLLYGVKTLRESLAVKVLG